MRRTLIALAIALPTLSAAHIGPDLTHQTAVSTPVSAAWVQPDSEQTVHRLCDLLPLARLSPVEPDLQGYVPADFACLLPVPAQK